MRIPSKLLVICLLALLPGLAHAQFDKLKDSMVQLSGIVMTADSLKALQGATVTLKREHRATVTNEFGIFNMLVMKGDTIQFTFVGYKRQEVFVPFNIPGNQYIIIKTMTADTQYLAVTIIRPRPTKAQFERDFVNLKYDGFEDSIIKLNMDPKILKKLANSLPNDAGENSNYRLTNVAKSYYYSNQIPPMKIFDIPSWKKFIQLWKSGAYKQ
jgi:hypothetical protein